MSTWRYYTHADPRFLGRSIKASLDNSQPFGDSLGREVRRILFAGKVNDGLDRRFTSVTRAKTSLPTDHMCRH